MFGISTTEFLLILAVGLIVFGPQKLPELARALGRAIGEFRKATSEIKQTFEADENIAKVKETFDRAVAEGMRSGLTQETVEEAAQSDAIEKTLSPDEPAEENPYADVVGAEYDEKPFEVETDGLTGDFAGTEEIEHSEDEVGLAVRTEQDALDRAKTAGIIDPDPDDTTPEEETEQKEKA